MKAVGNYLRVLVDDSLFIRVVMFLWGVPFAVLGVAILSTWEPSAGWGWLAAVMVVGIALIGLSLLAIAMFGSEETVGKVAASMDGADVLAAIAIILVGVIAIPVTILLRSFRRQQKRPLADVLREKSQAGSTSERNGGHRKTRWKRR